MCAFGTLYFDCRKKMLMQSTMHTCQNVQHNDRLTVDVLDTEVDGNLRRTGIGDRIDDPVHFGEDTLIRNADRRPVVGYAEAAARCGDSRHRRAERGRIVQQDELQVRAETPQRQTSQSNPVESPLSTKRQSPLRTERNAEGSWDILLVINDEEDCCPVRHPKDFPSSTASHPDLLP